MKTVNIWEVRLKNAEKRGHFTEYEKDLVSRWRTCAIGERYIVLTKGKKLPKILNTGDENLNPKADDLGLRFYDQVQEDNIKKAIQTYKQIQKLSTPSQIYNIK
jgi:hypothetical protein